MVSNEINYILITSLCNAKYFKGKYLVILDCQETLCENFCNKYENIINQDCHKNCINKSNDVTYKQQIENFEFLINKHSFFDSRLISLPAENLYISYSNLNSTKLEEQIEKSKQEVEILKKRLIEEENKLLKLYKSKT